MTEKLEKLKQGYANLSEWLEHIMAAIVLIAIVIAICSLWAPFKEFLQTRSESGAFLKYMASVFDIVIGIEFFKLLCKPRKDTILKCRCMFNNHMSCDYEHENFEHRILPGFA